MRFAFLLLLLLPLADRPPAADDAVLAAAKREIRAIRDADAVVLARVERVHRGPEIWCGTLVTRQVVTWRIDEVISTSLPAPKVGDRVRVGHLLVGGGIVHKDFPSVRSDLAYAGARAILLVHREKEGFVVRDESCGVRLLDAPLVPDPDRRAILAAILDLPALAPYLHPEIAGRKPVRIALSAALPGPVPTLTKFDLPVFFFAKAELARDPHLEVTALEVGDDTARIAFRYAIEGVTGEAWLAKAEGVWKVTEAQVVER